MSFNDTTSPNSTPQMDLLLESSIPGFSVLSSFLSQWFSLDIKSLAAMFFFVGAAWRPLQIFMSRIYWTIVRFFTATISIPPADKLSHDVMAYLAAEVIPRQGVRVLTAKSEYIPIEAMGRHRWNPTPNIPAIEKALRDEKSVPIDYYPSFERIVFTYKWNIFVVHRVADRFTTNDKDAPEEFMAAPTGEESVVVMCLGRSVEPIKRFLEHCRTFTEHSRDKFVAVRSIRGGYNAWDEPWDSMVLRPARPISTVHFDEKVKHDLISDIKEYMEPKTKHFYMSRGIPYRRGYLLHGPPGTGKTSLSLALASLFQLDLYLLHLPTIKFDGDRTLTKLFMALPQKCIVLIEDVDAVGLRRTAEEKLKEKEDLEGGKGNRGGNGECTLSGLLNALDGVASHEGRIVLMTTNHPEQLDRALIRPGRIDRQVYLGHINQDSARMMFLRMYSTDNRFHVNPLFASAPAKTPSTSEAVPWEKSPLQMSDMELASYSVKFASEIPEETFTPAQIQGFLLKHWDSPDDAAREIKTWVPAEIKIMEDEKEAIRKEEEAARKKAAKSANKMVKMLGKAAKDMDTDDSDVDHVDVDDSDFDEEVEAELKKLAKKSGKKGKGKKGGEKESEKTKKVTDTEETSDKEEHEHEEAHEGGDEKDEEDEGEKEQKSKISTKVKRRKSDLKTLVNGKDAAGPKKATVKEGGEDGEVNEGAALHTPPDSD